MFLDYDTWLETDFMQEENLRYRRELNYDEYLANQSDLEHESIYN